jgi:hypothetical protein
MAETYQQDTPAYVSKSAQNQRKALQIIRDLSAGTPRMRERGQTYLPMEAGESSTAYGVRLSRSLLFNAFVKVREGMIGIALKKNPNLDGEDAEGNPDPVPDVVKAHAEDIDLNGNHLDVFIKDVFRNVLNDGHAFILVDMQKRLDRSSVTLSPTPTAEDDVKLKRRPYWVKYTKDQAINWKSDRVDGETVLTQITFKECATESDGNYTEKEIVRYRVLRLRVVEPKTPTTPAIYGSMEWELHEERSIDGKSELVQVAGGPTTLDRIPVVTIYARQTGFLESQPPLEDLAYLNVGHWQQWSDLNCQIRMLVPILEIKGELAHTEARVEGAQTPKVAVGPGAALQFKDTDGGIEYKSADPGATGGMREALTDLEQRMSAVGLSIISPKPNQVGQASTATEKVLDQDERTSELASWLRALKDGVEAALEIHAVDYLGLPTGGSIILGFDEVTPTDQQAVMAINAPKGGQMPQNMPPQNAGMVQ